MCCTWLGIDSAEAITVGDFRDGFDVGSGPHVGVLVLAHLEDVIEGAIEDIVEASVDFCFGPEEGLEVLNPFEIGDGDAASVGEDIWDEKDAALGKDDVGVWGSGTVGTFDDDASLDFAGVFGVDLVFDSGRDEDTARGDEEIFVADMVGVAVGDDAAVLLGGIADGGDIEAMFVIDSAVEVA